MEEDFAHCYKSKTLHLGSNSRMFETKMKHSIELEFLGTGTSQGVPVIGCNCVVCTSTNTLDKRLRSSVLVTMNDVKIVVDTGTDFRQQMLRSNTNRIDAVLYTHAHADHVLGLDDIRAINFQQKMDMPLYATEQTEQSIRSIFHYAFSENKYPGVPQVYFERIGGKPFTVLGHAVMPIAAQHGGMEVTGFRFGDLTYLTDVKSISAKELDKVRGSKTVIINALRLKEHHSHFNLQQALEFLNEIAPQQGYLTHISHLLGTHERVSSLLPSNVHLAYDGLKLTA